MTAQFDLDLLPIYRINGQEWPSLPGLLTVHPPKKAARGRDGDHLVIFLTLSGNVPFSSADYSRLTTQLANQFYKTPGSLTSAMRATAENLNQFLMDRNLRSTGRGQYAIGRLLLGVLRAGQLVLIQSGPTHVFQIGPQIRHIHDAQISGRGLGLGQSTPIYFTQLELTAGDILVLCPQLPSNWDTAIISEHGGTSLDALRQKLVNINREDINAVLIQVQAGNSKVVTLSGTRSDSEQVKSPHAVGTTPEQSSPGARLASILEGNSKPEGLPDNFQAPPAATSKDTPQELLYSGPTELPSERRARAIRTQSQYPPQEARQDPQKTDYLEQGQAQEPAATKKGLASYGKQAARWLANLIGWSRRSRQSFTEKAGRFVPNLLPGEEGQAQQLPGSVMVLTAIIVPLIIVTIATVVYYRYGSAAQYEENYKLAIQSAVEAVDAEDFAIIRHAWETTLFYLDKAEAYQETQQSQDLREQAQSALDGMDGVVRIDFRPAIVGGLSKTVQISHMAATETELYLLNATNGSVIRTFLTNQGYAVDAEFTCGPGLYGGHQVGPLLDIGITPTIGITNTILLGMDANGTLIYCAPGEEPLAYPLEPPDTAFRGVNGFTLDSDGENLYVLDPLGNAVWVYSKTDDEFNDFPILFFSENPPAEMPDAIDILATSEFLYLLYKDGHITLCSISQIEEVPMRCYDPVTLQDERPGHQSGATITDAIFTQMSFSVMAAPALYMLVPNNHAIYQFSAGAESLTLRGQFRATIEQSRQFFTSPAMAMAISLKRYLFISIGNEVYFATDVP